MTSRERESKRACVETAIHRNCIVHHLWQLLCTFQLVFYYFWFLVLVWFCCHNHVPMHRDINVGDKCELRTLRRVGEELWFYRLIGVLWLCAGNDRLDELPVGGFHSQLRGVLRCRTWLHPVDDHRRTVLAGTQAQCHGNSSTSQLDGQFRSGNRIPQYESKHSEEESEAQYDRPHPRTVRLALGVPSFGAMQSSYSSSTRRSWIVRLNQISKSSIGNVAETVTFQIYFSHITSDIWCSI